MRCFSEGFAWVLTKAKIEPLELLGGLQVFHCRKVIFADNKECLLQRRFRQVFDSEDDSKGCVSRDRTSHAQVRWLQQLQQFEGITVSALTRMPQPS